MFNLIRGHAVTKTDKVQPFKHNKLSIQQLKLKIPAQMLYTEH